MNESELAAGLAPTPQYRYADRVGDRLYVAGQVPLDASGRLVGPDDPVAQTRQCLQNLLTLVAHHGFDASHLRHLVIHVVGPHQHLLDAWETVTECFEGEVPPATLLGAAMLGYTGQLVEIDATIDRG